MFIRRSQLYSLLVVSGQHEGADKRCDAMLRLPSPEPRTGAALRLSAQAPIQSAFGNSTKFSKSASFLRNCLAVYMSSFSDASCWQSLSQNITFPPPTQAQVRGRRQTSGTASGDRDLWLRSRLTAAWDARGSRSNPALLAGGLSFHSSCFPSFQSMP